MRIDEELDYELEAQNQRAMARIFRGHPFIVIPDVITSLSRERVMVTEFVSGTGFEELKSYPQARARPHRRDRVPLLLRLHVPPPPVLRRPPPRQLHAARRRSRRVPRLRPVQADAAGRRSSSRSQVARAIIEGDTDTIMRARHRGRLLPRARQVRPRARARALPRRDLVVHARPTIELTPEIATQVLIDMSDPRSEYFGQLRHESAPPDHLFGRRMEVLTLAVIAPAARARQLPPDRPRVDLRRPAGDRLGAEASSAETAFCTRPLRLHRSPGRIRVRPAGSGAGWSSRGARSAARR